MTAPVLVAGAGPTGLAAACALSSFGVPVRILDKRTGPDPKPRAIVVWSGAMEVLDRLGVAEEVAEGALPIRTGRYLSGGREIAALDLLVPGTRWKHPLSVPQPLVEQALRRRLAGLGVEVEWGHRAVGTREEGGRLLLESVREGPEAQSVRIETAADYLVAADGGRSVLREQLGIERSGRTFPRDFLLVDGALRFPGGPPSRRTASYHLSDRGVVVVVPLRDGSHRVFIDLPPDPSASRDAEAVVEEVSSELRRRFAAPPRIDEAHWASRFSIHAKVADRFREGRVLLAGDAAHVHSPAGGQGMNTGIQDAWDLSWRIAALRRGADPALLGGYDRERRRAAVRAVRQAELQTRMWLLGGGPLSKVRNVVVHRALASAAARRTAVQRLAQLRWPLGEGAARFRPGAPGPRPGDRLSEFARSTKHVLLLLGGEPSRAAEAREALARRLPHCEVLGRDGRPNGDPLLVWVRPDAMVGARSRWADRGGLLKLLGGA
ncbi:MAG: FAD-dependent monooxygenase [Pseudoclavibacter sp.]|nr:FAD-dependent monooxygenase [Pseudoclavibacter sp.]